LKRELQDISEYIYTIAGSVALCAGLHVWVLRGAGWPWLPVLTDAAVSTALIAVACAVTNLQYSFYQPGSRNRIYRLLFAVVITALVISTLRHLLSLLISNAAYVQFVEATVQVRTVVTFLLIAFVTIITWLTHALRDAASKEKRKGEIEQMARDAELARLRQQLQPHFLFNSLNSINALIGANPLLARDMVHKLSSFLRGTLHKDETAFVTLQSEIENLRLYLDIEKVRFGDRLAVDIQSADDVASALVPPLLLQPLMENAVKYGVYGTTGEVAITVNISRDGDFLKIVITNPFDEGTASDGTGYGLASVRRRLQLVYGDAGLLTISTEKNNFTASVILPLRWNRQK
jgi:two-component system, LytTR family, sensor kinase